MGINIYAVSVIKNDQDIIESFIRYNMETFDKIILYNDNSTDNTINILKKLKLEGLNIDILSYDKNMTNHDLLNEVLLESCPDWIIFLNPDDFLTCDENSPRDHIYNLNDETHYHVNMRTYLPLFSEGNYCPNIMKEIRTTSIDKEIRNLFSLKKFKEDNNEFITTNISAEAENLRIARFPIRSQNQLLVKLEAALRDYSENNKINNWYVQLSEKVIENKGKFTEDELINIAKTYLTDLKPDQIKSEYLPLNTSFCEDTTVKYFLYEKEDLDKIDLYNKLITKENRINKLSEEINRYKKELNEFKNSNSDKRTDNKTVDLLKEECNNLQSLNQELIKDVLENENKTICDSLNTKNFLSYILIKNSDLFDEKWYKKTYDLRKDIDPIDHFLTLGSREGFNPSELFDSKWYKREYNLKPNTNSLLHYLVEGKKNYYLKKDVKNENYFDIKDTQEYRIINESNLFDKEWYKKQYNIDNNDSLTHYLTKGYVKGFNPSELFDINDYSDNEKTNRDIFIEYIIDNSFLNDDKNGFDYDDVDIKDTYEYTLISESGLFDSSYYLKKYELNVYDPIAHYILKGYKKGYNPNSNFDSYWYTINHDEIINNGQIPLINYILSGKIYPTNPNYSIIKSVEKPIINKKDNKIKTETDYSNYNLDDYELLNNSKYFNKEFYLKHNKSIPANIDPLVYFIVKGWKNNDIVSKYFDPEYYLEYNPDIASSGLNPLIHYIKSGKQEKRLSHWAPLYDDSGYDEGVISDYNLIQKSEWFNNEWYLNSNPIKDKENTNPILHYLLKGTSLGYDPHWLFSTCNYLEKGDVSGSNINPLVHYLKYGKQEYRKLEASKDYIEQFDNTKFSYLESVRILKVLNEKVTIILPVITDDKKDQIDICVKSILANTYNYNLVIVDDCTNNKEYLEELGNVPNITIIHNRKKLGYIKSINEVIKNTNFDVVLIDLNTIFTSNWLINLIKTIYKYNAGIVTPLPNCILSHKFKKDLNIAEINKYARLIYKNANQKLLYTESVKSNIVYIRNNTIKKIGLFDDKLDKINALISYSIKANIENMNTVVANNVFVYQKENNIPNMDGSNLINEAIDSKLLKLPESYNPNLLKEESCLIDNYEGNDKLNILYVTDKLNKKVIDYGNNHYLMLSDNIFVLTQNTNYITVLKKELNKQASSLEEIHCPDELSLDEEIKIYFNILTKYKIDVIIVRPTEQYLTSDYTGTGLFVEVAPSLNIQSIYELDHSIKTMETMKKFVHAPDSYDDPIEKYISNIDFNKKKIAVYTTRLGSTEDLTVPQYINNNVDYVCFTNNTELKQVPWDVRLIENNNLSKEEIIEQYKLFPYMYLEEYDYSIWIDDDIRIAQDLERYINTYYHNKGMLLLSDEVNPNLLNSKVIVRDHSNEKIKELIKNYKYNDSTNLKDSCDISNLNTIKNGYFYKNSRHLELKYDVDDVNDSLDALDKKVSIIIPIYNAFEETKNCIESVLRNTEGNYEIILINDCSSDKNMKPYLDSLNEKYEQIQVIHNKTNQGFIKNINKGIYETLGDVILLNSDTIVTPRWLTKLVIAAYSSDNIGTVTPVSNNAGAFSVPLINQKNIVNNDLGLDETANIIEKVSKDKGIRVPTGNGFCMYIKRDAIYDIGFFDEIFGKGYCEENDFCMRLIDNNWLNVLDESTYIYHVHNVSFSDEKKELITKNRKTLNEKHPTYTRQAHEFVNSASCNNIRKSIKYALDTYPTKPKKNKRLLYVLHEGAGGTLHTSVELASQIDKGYDVFILTAQNSHMKLFKYDEFKNIKMDSDEYHSFVEDISLIDEWDIDEKYTIKKESLDEWKRVYYNILLAFKIDIIHIRHLIRHTFDLPYIANKLKIPIVLSFHDFYYVCPSHCLLDDNHKYCAGQCTPIQSNNIYNNLDGAQCEVSKGLRPPLLKTFIHTWRQRVRKLFEMCNAFVTTSEEVKRIYISIYPELVNKDFRVIEHGRDLKTPNDPIKYVEIPSMDKPIKIVFPGHLNHHKGSDLIEQIKSYDKNNKLEYHYLGSVHPDTNLEEIGINHGFYNRNDFCRLIHEIKPSYIGILSIWPETYCHTLTEAWNCGIPVLTIDIGALGERVKANGGGFFLSEDPEIAYNEIINISKDKKEYVKTVNEIKDIKFKSIKQMGNEYDKIYKKILNNFKNKED